jgi:predicted RNA polymerase sigma factor
MAVVHRRRRVARVCAIVALWGLPTSAQTPDPLVALNRTVALAESSLRNDERQLA